MTLHIRRQWERRAACAQPGVDANLFFPPAGRESSDAYAARVTAAKKVCFSCPVLSECLIAAVDHDDAQGDLKWAIRGGLTPNQRRRQLREAYAA